MKKYMAVVIALIAGFCAGFVYAVITEDADSDPKDYDFALISEEIKEISELASLEERYSAEVPYTSKSRKLWKTGIDIPLSKKGLTAEYDGIIKMGLDMKDFSEKNINVSGDGQKITVSLPKSVILSHEIDEDSWVLKDKKNGLFNRLKPEDDAKLRKYAKKQALKAIKTDELLKHADENASAQIKSLLETICPGVEIEVVTE